MRIRVEDDLPFVSAVLEFNEHTVQLDHLLLDTGSAGTFLAIDQVDSLDILPEPDDAIYQIVGVGGSEYVFSKRVDALIVGDLEVHNFSIEFGAMRYGIQLDGIVGLDFLRLTGAFIDLARMEIYGSSGSSSR